jgi:hypothetical protein
MEPSSNSAETYQSLRDLGLVAALVTRDFKIVRIEKVAGRCHFLFRDTPDLQMTVGMYWTNELEVSARQYAENTKMLKSRIYSEAGV